MPVRLSGRRRSAKSPVPTKLQPTIGPKIAQTTLPVAWSLRAISAAAARPQTSAARATATVRRALMARCSLAGGGRARRRCGGALDLGRRCEEGRPMSGRWEGTTVVDRPIEEVFAFLADGENDRKFSARVQEIRKATDGPPGAGTVYASTVKDAGMTTKREFEITEF